MIPNVHNSRSADGLWSFLKSVEHALNRLLEASAAPLAQLDRERLEALTRFLRESIEAETPGETLDLAGLAGSVSQNAPPAYPVDIRERIASLPEFDQWRKTQRLGFEKKVLRLIEALEAYLKEPTFVADRLPREEVELLKVVVKNLLVDAEATFT